MMRSLWTASTGMAAQSLNVDVISNNISNVNTTGFKRGRANFQDLMYQQVKAPGSEASASGTQLPTGIQIGLGVKAAGVSSNFSEGSFQQTNNELDMTIQGRGFFQVQLPNGDTGYTRDGKFSVDATGQLVTQNGDLVQPGITVPTDSQSVHVAADGTVSVVQAGGIQSVIGQIEIADFINPSGLTHMGSNLFQPSNASGQPVVGPPAANGLGSIGQGMLEMSNVNMVEEMVNLIAAQRAYEMNSKAIQAADEMLKTANNVRR